MEEDDTEPSAISLMQAEVVDCLALLMSKEEEAFQPYLSAALSDVWTLLMATDRAAPGPPRDDGDQVPLDGGQLAAPPALRDRGVLQNVCEKIIAPNVQLLPADEENFDDNPFEYVRRDAEGSDADTRRRVSRDFIVALCRNYESQLTTLFSGYIGSLLQQASASPAMWKAKDAAVYLVIALTLRGSTAKLGATQTNRLVNLMDFYSASVLPELQRAQAGGAGAPHPPRGRPQVCDRLPRPVARRGLRPGLPAARGPAQPPEDRRAHLRRDRDRADAHVPRGAPRGRPPPGRRAAPLRRAAARAAAAAAPHVALRRPQARRLVGEPVRDARDPPRDVGRGRRDGAVRADRHRGAQGPPLARLREPDEPVVQPLHV